MPELFKDIWTCNINVDGCDNHGLMFDFISGKLISRKFGYDTGISEEYLMVYCCQTRIFQEKDIDPRISLFAYL